MFALSNITNIYRFNIWIVLDSFSFYLLIHVKKLSNFITRLTTQELSPSLMPTRTIFWRSSTYLTTSRHKTCYNIIATLDNEICHYKSLLQYGIHSRNRQKCANERNNINSERMANIGILNNTQASLATPDCRTNTDIDK